MEENMIVDSNRYLFHMNCDVEKYVDGTRFLFADELAEYTIIPYVNKLKNVPGFRENKALFVDARIYLLATDNRSVRRVPCNIVEEQKSIYISEGTFNRYWKRISAQLWNGLKRLSEETVTQEDMNGKIDLSYVEALYRTVEISPDYTLVYDEKIPESEEKSHCKQDSDKRVLIQVGAQDYKRYKERYLELFEKVSEKHLYDLFVLKQAYCCWTNNELYIVCDEDHWRIVNNNGEFCLLHNSYSTCLGGERIFAQSWHKEKAKTVNQALRTICTYNYCQHRKWREQRLLQQDASKLL